MLKQIYICLSLIVLLTFVIQATAQSRGGLEAPDQQADRAEFIHPGQFSELQTVPAGVQQEIFYRLNPSQLLADPTGPVGPTVQSRQPFRYIHGRLSYRKKTGSGFERGREDWWLTENRDGSRTMRTLAMTDDSKFVRDVIYTLGPDQRPLQVFIQLQVDKQLIGSGYFRVSGDTMNIVTDGIDTGHTVQAVKVPQRFHVLTHAVMLDGWPSWAFDAASGGTQTIAVYTTSPLWNGTSGPLGRMTEQRFTLVGTEQITVPAGTFQARHFSFGGDEDPDRASHVWVTGENNILVKYDWPPYGMEYLLESLTTETQAE